MKSSKKVLAFALAAAMVVTAVPATNAQAAAKTAKLSSKTVTVAVGSAKKQTKSIKVVTPSNWKNVKVKVSSSNKKVATVKATGKTVKVTGVKKGTAKVTVKVTAKKGKKAVKKTLSAKATVINAGLKFTNEAAEVTTGATLDLAVKKSPKAAKLTFESSDTAVATVSPDGVVTGVKAGKATITVTSDYGKTIKKDVTVKDTVAQLTDVKQTASNAFTATFSADASKITKDDIKVIAADGSSEFVVKSVEFSADKLSAEVTVYNNFSDAKEYNVTYKDATKTFKASVGEVTGVTVKTTEAPLNAKTRIDYVLTDAAGIDVTPAVDLDAKCLVKVEGTYAAAETANASEAYITMAAINDVANVTVTYDNGSKDFTPVAGKGDIKCVPAQAVKAAPLFASASGVNVNDKSECAKFYLGLSAKDISVAVNDSKTDVFFCAKDDNGDVISYDKYDVKSANDDVASVSATVDTGKFAKLTVNGNSVGSTTLIVTASKNGSEKSYTIPVTVTKEKTAVKMTVEASRPTMSNAYDSDYKNLIKAQLLDEDNNKVKGNFTFEITTPNATNTSLSDTSVVNTTEAKSYFTAAGASAKIYTVKITGSDLKTDKTFERNVTVNVKALADTVYNVNTGAAMTYAVEMLADDGSLNSKLDENTSDKRNVTARLYATANGLFAGYVRQSGSTVTIGDTNTTTHTYATANAATTLDDVTVAAKYGTLAFKPGNGYLTSTNVVSGSAATLDTAYDSYSGSGVKFKSVNATSTIIYKENDFSTLAKLGNYTVEFRVHYADVNGKNNTKNTSTAADKTTKYASVKNSFSVTNTVKVPTVTVTNRKVDSSNVLDYKQNLKTDVDMNNNTSDYESILVINDANYTKPVNEKLSTDSKKVTVKNVIVEDDRVNDGEVWNFYIPINSTFTLK